MAVVRAGHVVPLAVERSRLHRQTRRIPALVVHEELQTVVHLVLERVARVPLGHELIVLAVAHVVRPDPRAHGHLVRDVQACTRTAVHVVVDPVQVQGPADPARTNPGRAARQGPVVPIARAVLAVAVQLPVARQHRRGGRGQVQGRVEPDVVNEDLARACARSEPDRDRTDLRQVHAHEPGQRDLPLGPGGLCQGHCILALAGPVRDLGGLAGLVGHLEPHGQALGVIRGPIEADRQGLQAAPGPIPHGLEGPCGLGSTIVVQGHGLGAAMDDRPLGIRLRVVTDRRPCAIARVGRHTAVVIGPIAGPALPRVVHPVAPVVVGLKVVNHLILGGREAPQIASPGPDRCGLVDLVHTPGVGLSILGPQRGQGNLVFGHGPGKGQGIGVCPEVDLVADCLSPGTPTECGVQGNACRSIDRVRLEGPRGGLEEPDLAEAVGPCPAPTALHGQPHIPGQQAAQVHGRVVGVVRPARGLGELGHVGHGCPGRPVCGALDRHLPGPIVDQGPLCGLVGVPDPQLVHLVHAIELVLDPRRVRRRDRADPHIQDIRGVLIAGQPPFVDGPFRTHQGLADPARGRGVNGRDRIRVRLHSEAPDIALVDEPVGRGIDLVHPPGIGPAELQQAGRVIGRVRLALADEHMRRVRGPAGHVHVLETRAEVHVMRGGELARPPTQGGVARHVVCPLRRGRFHGLALGCAGGEDPGHVRSLVDIDKIHPERDLAGRTEHLELCAGVPRLRGQGQFAPLGPQLEACGSPDDGVVDGLDLHGQGTRGLGLGPEACGVRGADLKRHRAVDHDEVPVRAALGLHAQASAAVHGLGRIDGHCAGQSRVVAPGPPLPADGVVRRGLVLLKTPVGHQVLDLCPSRAGQTQGHPHRRADLPHAHGHPPSRMVGLRRAAGPCTHAPRHVRTTPSCTKRGACYASPLHRGAPPGQGPAASCGGSPAQGQLVPAPLTFMGTEYRDVPAVMSRVFPAGPPKHTLDGVSGTSIVSSLSPFGS